MEQRPTCIEVPASIKLENSQQKTSRKFGTIVFFAYLCPKKSRQCIMERKEIADKWLEQVNEDIATAECLFQGGHWLYIGFLCHQAIEKAIKAYWLAMRDDEPIYLHNHFRLLEGCELKSELNEEQRRFIEIMAPMYIAGRYPEYKNQVARMLNEKGSAYIIEQTKQFKEWILQRFSQEKRPLTL